LNGIEESKVYKQKGADSMSATKDQAIKEKKGQDRDHDPIKDLCEDMIINKEPVSKSKATLDVNFRGIWMETLSSFIQSL
jgi:hypothetical protein